MALGLEETTKRCLDRLVYVVRVYDDGRQVSQRKTLQEYVYNETVYADADVKGLKAIVVRDAAFGYVITSCIFAKEGDKLCAR